MSWIKKIGKRLLSYTPSSAIVVFHHVTDKPVVKCSNCMISEDQFIKFLDTYDRFDTLTNVINKPWMRKIAITFDDGLEDLYTIAYPILKRKQIPFTVYIITDFIGKAGYMTHEQIKQLADDSIVEIASHGVTHEIMPSLNLVQKQIELFESQKKLEQLFGKKIKGFAYSHGQYDSETLRLIKRYEYAVTVYDQPINIITKLMKYRLPRFNVDADSYNQIFNSLLFIHD